MSFEWDEEKNATNIRNRGVDFRDAALIIKNPRMDAVDDGTDYGEFEMHRAWVIRRNGAARRVHLARRKRCPHY